MTHPLYPISLNLSGRPCLVVGGGGVAERKAEGLRQAGALVTVVAPEAGPALRASADRGELVWRFDRFRPDHVDGCAVCIAATDDTELNQLVAAEARRRGVPVNVVDRPELCDFEVPAVVRRGRFQVAVSTGGASPLLAARVRRELEERYGPEFASVTAALGEVRRELKRAEPDSGRRREKLRAALGAALEWASDRAGPAAELDGTKAVPDALKTAVRRAAGLKGRVWRVGCRGSELSRRQTGMVIEDLRSVAEPGTGFEVVVVTTGGDLDASTPLANLGQVGVFTSELEQALRDGTIDLAVHSLKDMPTITPSDLTLAAVTRRADPRDALISRSGLRLAELPSGSVVGTSSPRRAAQVLRLRPDLVCRPLRGNVDTRLRRLEEGLYDAIILAAAGLERLGRLGRATELLDPDTFIPAPAQGFLAVECRAADQPALALAGALQDPEARLAAEAERAFLRRLGAGCHAPAGAYATVCGDGDRYRLDIRGIALSDNGGEAVEGRAEDVLPSPVADADTGAGTAGAAYPEVLAAARLGARLAEDLLARGAGRLVAGAATEGAGPAPALTRTATGALVPTRPRPGTVYLVGAGPGDAGLITMRGAELLRRAQCVVVDRLANPSLLELVPPGCEVIAAGKEPGCHSLGQEEISQLLIQEARSGRDVVRLKGGDPFVFGRGGEEAEALRAAGIRFEVVPGVSSAVAGPAYAGIPVTHRGQAQSVALATGHGEGGGGDTPDFGRLAGAVDTLVVLMGTRRLPEIVDEILRGGRPPTTPASVVASATTADQRTVSGTLADIAGRVESAGIRNPALIVVGEVAALRHSLAWHEDRPLAGRRIVVTRSREQASRLTQVMEDLGADVFRFPAIHIERPAPGSDEERRLDEAAARLGDFAWVAFTSVNGVDVFFDRLTARGRDARSLAGCRVAAIGPATAGRLRERGIRPDLVPEEFRGEALAAALKGEADAPSGAGPTASGKGSVLLVRSNLGRPVVVEELREAGFTVYEVHAYRLVPGRESPARAFLRRELVERLETGRIDALTFASSATVTNFMSAVGTGWLDRTPVPPAVFCIGPVTAGTARELGLEVTGVADKYTIDGLVGVVAGHYQGEGGCQCST